MVNKNYLLERYLPSEPEPEQEISESRIREEVIRLVAWGIEPASIATLMRIPLQTLEREYPEELANGATILQARAAGRIYEIGMTSKDHRAALTALLAILRYKGGWKEAKADNQPQVNINAQAVQFVLPKQLTEEDWAEATETLRKRLGAIPDPAVLEAEVLTSEKK
jgi:hypothetical protein